MLRLRRFGQGCSRGSVWFAGDLLAEEVASDGADGQNFSVLVALLWYVLTPMIAPHTKGYQPWRTAPRSLRLSVLCKTRLLCLVSLQTLGGALV